MKHTQIRIKKRGKTVSIFRLHDIMYRNLKILPPTKNKNKNKIPVRTNKSIQ